MNIRIGTSGWNYPEWRKTLSKGVAAKGQLQAYAGEFDTVEINSTFYRAPKPETLAGWRTSTPVAFRFGMKASRSITHYSKLAPTKDEQVLLLQTMRGFGRKLGPVLFQLPPKWEADPARLEAYLRTLPMTHRYAFELRNLSWVCPEVLALLRRWKIAYVCWDLRGVQNPVHLTTDFAYIRLHGPRERAYFGSYSMGTLKRWAKQIRAWDDEGCKTVYVFFDNTADGSGLKDARRLRKLFLR